MKLFCEPAELDQLADSWTTDFEVIELVSPLSLAVDPDQFFLRLDAGILRLCFGEDVRGVWVEPDEIKRRLKGDFLLGRACGISRARSLTILDATAGLGVDGMALWRTGQRVHLVEREPVLAALLVNLLRRLNAVDVELTTADSVPLLKLERSYDVIYFDPMFSPRHKSALPGKRMQYLNGLLRDEEEFETALISLAQSKARSRVVLKRRAKDPVSVKPDWSIRGRAVRYDVYQGRFR